MSSDDDSYSFNESQTFGRIVELLKLRTQPNRRRLYDIEPAARRSLKVQKIFKKPRADEVDNLVFEEPVNDVAVQDDSEVMETPVTSPTRIPVGAQKKSVFCSTPMAIDATKKFTSSLSPVKNISVGPISQLDKFAVLAQKSQNTISTAPTPEVEYNLKLMQPRIVLTDVIVNKKKPNTNPNARQLSPSSQIAISNPVKRKLKNGTKSYSVTQSSPSNSTDTPRRSRPSKRTTNCSSQDCETLKPHETRLNCRYLGNSESNRGRSEFPTEGFLPELSLKLTSAGRHMPQSSDLDPKSSTFNATHRNAELPPNLNSKRSGSLIGSSRQKQAAEISNSLKNSIRECSASSEIDNLLVIPGNNDETENGTSTTSKTKRSNHNEILNVEVTQKTSQLHPHDLSVVGVSTSSSLVAQSISKTQQQVSRSQNPVRTRVRKKKINDSYLNFLALEKSANRKSSNSGSKRKLYSSEYQSTNLTVTKDNGSGSTQGDRNFKVTPTLIQSPLMIDSEGFKVPNTTYLTNSFRKENADDPIGSVESEIGIIVENIQPALAAEKTCEITKDKFTSKHPGGKKRRKPSTPKITQNNVEGDTTGLRRSTRIKHTPMTFWKVNKEPLADYQTKFYNKMIADRSPKKKPNKARPIAKIVEPIPEDLREPRLNVVIEEVETIPIEKNTNLQETRNEETETVFRSAITLAKSNTKKQNKSDSALQETAESEDQTNPHIKFLKKFGADCLSDEDPHRTQRMTSSDDLRIDNLAFKKLANMPGVEFSFIPNSNDMIGFLKLQCGSKKAVSRTSRKYFLTLMLFTETSVTVKVNEKAMEMILGELDLVQLPPDSKYELINNSPKPAILMTMRTLVK